VTVSEDEAIAVRSVEVLFVQTQVRVEERRHKVRHPEGATGVATLGGVDHPDHILTDGVC
jgi:hypothetical protein